MSESEASSLQHITYKFKFKDNSEKVFDIAIDPDTYDLVRSSDTPLHEWTRLEKFACRNCPLSKDEHDHCPIAVNLMDIIEFFSEIPSFEKVQIEVKTDNRTYLKDTSVQQGVSGVIGIVMVTSGCPVLGKLKPMGRFHLPFADLEETQVRIFSFYLLAQFLRLKKGELPDWNMDELADLYARIADININIANKIASLEKQDASINAVVVLNNFAASVTLSIDDNLEMIEPFLKEFVEDLNSF